MIFFNNYRLEIKINIDKIVSIVNNIVLAGIVNNDHCTDNRFWIR